MAVHRRADLDLKLRKGALCLRVKARGRDLGGADSTHLGVTLRVGAGSSADCWSALALACQVASGGDKLSCR